MFSSIFNLIAKWACNSLKNYFSLCLGFPKRKQGLQLLSMAAVLQWIQSGWKILQLDCV